MADRGKILYIAGTGRSGSTILDKILGQVEGLFSVGELSDIWERGSESHCTCGSLVGDCEAWVEVFRGAFGVEPRQFDFARCFELVEKSDRLRHLWWLTNRAARKLKASHSGLDEYLNLTRLLYRAVFAVSGAAVIVDSSKHPSHGYLLELSDAADLYVLHLVRDSRASAYSWQRKKPDPGLPNGDLGQFSPLTMALKWDFNNLACEWLWRAQRKRYLRLSYEEFAVCPRETTDKILRFVGRTDSVLPFVSDRAVMLGQVHGIAGNPVRYASGITEIRPDNEWESKMGRLPRLAVTSLTAPWLARYGYRLGMRGTRNTAVLAGTSERHVRSYQKK